MMWQGNSPAHYLLVKRNFHQDTEPDTGKVMLTLELLLVLAMTANFSVLTTSLLSFLSTAPFFSTPAGLQDFTKKKNFLEWSNFISGTMNKKVKLEEKTVGAGKSQFYNPEIKPSGSDKATAKVTWNGFPRRLQLDFPDSYLEVADEKDGWPFDGEEKKIARNQDEYLEWYVYKNPKGKITRVDFTCEGPEYWDRLFQWEPETCLRLYRQYISPAVQPEDLYKLDDKGELTYNPLNKWNTTHGCMHLNCPPNSLDAEIQLAADASIIRKEHDKIVTDPQLLINCAKYGRPDRNSDPHIGSICNTLCRGGKRITIANPVCLFIDKVLTDGWTTPDGREAAQYMKMLRGTKGQGLRYSLEVPAEENFTVSDIMIAGEPIQYGGSVALLMNIGLTAEFCADSQGAQPAHECVPKEIHLRTMQVDGTPKGRSN